MRITRAYTITPEIKRILDTKANKSEYVCRAVRKMHLQQEELDLVDVPTRQLIAAAISRDDCLLYTSPSPRDMRRSRMPSSA